MKIEDNPAFAGKLFPICFALGGKDSPLKINEEFKVTGRAATYRIANDGTLQYRNDDMEFFAFCKTDTIYALINGTQHIIRRPQFSDDEKTMMREYMKFGYTVLRKPKEYGMQIESEKGWIPLPDGMFPQITPENSPFNFAAYLESEESK